MESLISGPGDRANVKAANRLARIVTCSYVRHKLQTLAWEHKINAEDDLATAMDACADNRSLAVLMQAHMISGHTPSWSRPCDELSFMRKRKILPPIGQGLADIEGYMKDALHRLYRQRNLVLHSGKTDAIAVDAALRTALPLVASGMDRIVAASVEQQLSAMELAARAKFAMHQYASARTSSIVDLLA